MSTTENQPQIQQPNQQPIVITLPSNLESKDEKEKIEKIFPQKFMLGLSILQLCLGGLAALLHIILLSVAHRSGIHEGGFGIWTGLVFGIAGGVGIIAANRPSNCMVISMLVLSIISTFFTIPLFLSASFGLGSSNRSIRYRDEDDNDIKNLRAAVAIYSIQLFIGLAQAVAAITTSAFSCRTVCCRKRSNAGTVIFAPVNAGGADARFVSLTLNTSSNAPATEVTENKPSETNFTTQINDDPPGYQEINLHSSDDQTNNHQKYQRFD